jgi:arylsulfatase
MRALWWSEAERYGVLPISASGLNRMFARRPSIGAPRKVYEYFPGGSPITFSAAPRVNNRAHSISALTTLPDGPVDGVLLSNGNRHGGYALYVKDRRLHFVHNYLSLASFRVSAEHDVPSGDVELRMEFAPTGPPSFLEGKGTPADVRLFYDGVEVGMGHLPYSVPSTFATTGLSCGWAYFDTIDPSAYEAPFTFSAKLHKVILDITGELSINPNAEMVRMMTQQ